MTLMTGERSCVGAKPLGYLSRTGNGNNLV